MVLTVDTGSSDPQPAVVMAVGSGVVTVVLFSVGGINADEWINVPWFDDEAGARAASDRSGPNGAYPRLVVAP